MVSLIYTLENLMATWTYDVLWIICGYITGSIPFGVIISKICKNIDPRTVGSGSSGTTNVYRATGLKCAIWVATADILKSMVPVFFILKILESRHLAMAVGLGCVLGHIWSCFLKFKGGKGIATGAGALFPFIPYWIGTAVILWLVVARYTRYAFLASAVATVTVVIGGWATVLDPVFTFFTTTLAGILFVAHKKNLTRFVQGKENKIEKKFY